MSFGVFVSSKPWVADVPLREDRLIGLAAEGDAHAFDDLMGRYDRELRSFLGRRTDSENLEDIMQDVRLAAWNGLRTFDRRSRFKTWLYSVAIHKYKDHYRKRARVDHEVPIAHLEGGFAGPDAFAQSDSKEFVRAILDTLSEDQREVIELYYCGSLNLPEISRTLGRNLNTVKYQFYRAHAQIADTLRRQKAVEASIQGDPHAPRL
jgi:RNA polymerase sigma-70 factor (ECF subfamily)